MIVITELTPYVPLAVVDVTPVTAGAVVSRLGVHSLRIGGEIDPGVPWTYAEGGATPLLLALKSGNFGARDFFIKAFEVLP